MKRSICERCRQDLLKSRKLVYCPCLCFVIDPKHRRIMKLSKLMLNLYFRGENPEKACLCFMEHTMYDLYQNKILKFIGKMVNRLVWFYLIWIWKY